MKTTLKTIVLSLAITLGLSLHGFAGPKGGTGTTSKTAMVITKGKIVHPGDVVIASKFANEDQAARAMVSNASGKQILDMKVELSSGQNQIRFHLGEVPSGIYFIKLVSGDNTETRSFYVQ